MVMARAIKFTQGIKVHLLSEGANGANCGMGKGSNVIKIDGVITRSSLCTICFGTGKGKYRWLAQRLNVIRIIEDT